MRGSMLLLDKVDDKKQQEQQEEYEPAPYQTPGYGIQFMQCILLYVVYYYHWIVVTNSNHNMCFINIHTKLGPGGM